MDEFKPNSYRTKYEKDLPEPKKKIEKVISGNVKSKKKGELSKFVGAFISEDASNVKSYLLMEVLIPSAKKAVSDIITNGLELLFYGETIGKKKGVSSKISYKNYYEEDRPRNNRVSTHSAYDYDELIFDNRGEADNVLSRMDELIYTYGLVSVADLYDLVGKTGDYTDNKYGWTDIRNAKIVRVRDGYIIKMPRASLLD